MKSKQIVGKRELFMALLFTPLEKVHAIAIIGMIKNKKIAHTDEHVGCAISQLRRHK